jgi:hypothetical protein
MQVGPNPTDLHTFTKVTDGETWYAGSGGTTLSFIVADANPGRDAPPLPLLRPRLNPMPKGTTIGVRATPGITATLGGGNPVPSTTEVTFAAVVVRFDDTSEGTVFVDFTSPSGVKTTKAIVVTTGTAPTSCPTP